MICTESLSLIRGAAPSSQLAMFSILVSTPCCSWHGRSFTASCGLERGFFGVILVGVSVDNRPGNEVQRAVVIRGTYSIFLSMKNKNDFRSGVFNIQYRGESTCDIVIFPARSPRLKDRPSFANVTQLTPPTLPSANYTNSASQLIAHVSRERATLNVFVCSLKPKQPLDRLDILISLLNLLVTVAEPPKDERVQNQHREYRAGAQRNDLHYSRARRQAALYVLTYATLIYAAWWASVETFDPSASWMPAAFRIVVYLD